MSRKRWVITLVLGTAIVGSWATYRHMRASLFASAGPISAVVAGQTEIHFGFEGVKQPDGIPMPWQSRIIKGTLHINLVNGPDSAGKKAVRVECTKSHFLIWNSSCPYSPDEFPVLKWSWKATVLPTNGDVRFHNPVPLFGDNRSDAAVQVLVGFEGNDVLCYLWDSTAPIGTEVEEPSPVARVRTAVIDSGPAHLNEWVRHQVNIREDYHRRYGKPPGKVLGISIQTNSNHTASRSEGIISEIVACRP